MMKKQTIILIGALILAGCSTAASYQADCFEKYNEFRDAVDCTREALNNDFRMHLPLNHAFVSTLFAYMDMIAEDVEAGKLSKSEGQFLIADKINKLDAAQRDRLQKQKLINAMKRPASSPTSHTSCMVMGQMVNCTSH